MGARPSQFKKGGGFLNGVDGQITGYQWTDEFNGEPFKGGKDKTGKARFHSLYFVPSVRVDGAEEDITTTLFAGGYDDFEVSDDGLTITPHEEGRQLGQNTAFYTFINSLVKPEHGDGFPEERLSEDDINYEPIIGSRVRFEQRVNADNNKKLGKRKDKRTGKEYDRQDLVVSEVYSLPGETQSVTKASTVGSKVIVGTMSSKVTGGNGKITKKVDTSVADLAAATLASILAANKGTITKQKLGMRITNNLMKHPQREDVRKWLADDDNLGGLAFATFDPATSVISLDADSGNKIPF